MTSTTLDTTFVPADLDATRWEALHPLYQALETRPVASRAELDRWVLDRSELDAAAGEARANLYITMTCHTDDAEASARWTRYIEEVAPKLKPVSAALDRRQADLHDRLAPDDPRYAVLVRALRNEIELYREQNVGLETELSTLDQRYDQICGAMEVEFGGERHTMPQMARFQESTDRALRESAWRASADRRLADKDEVSSILDRMITLRHACATNAGFDTFRDFEHRRKGRFDYTPSDCEAFHRAIERHAVPFMRRLDDRRRERLGLAALRPWDLSVDERGRDPLRPFTTGQDLVERTRRIYARIDPTLAALFRDLGGNLDADGCFDLDSRRGKASGGYQYMRDRSRRPFIFMNAAGLQRDVQTMVHEAGHAFHSMLCEHEPLVWYRSSPIEFAEVASMTQELLTMPEWDEFYASPIEADRARRAQLEGAIAILPWIATIDAYQHWLYTHPTHSRNQRRDAWLALDERFGHVVDWSGLDDHRAHLWQRQGHLFGNPFYYVEYGIAQLGALGVWARSLAEGRAAALRDYCAGLALGGSRPLPELFQRAGVPFDFSEAAVGGIVEAVERHLEILPD